MSSVNKLLDRKVRLENFIKEVSKAIMARRWSSDTAVYGTSFILSTYQPHKVKESFEDILKAAHEEALQAARDELAEVKKTLEAIERLLSGSE